MTFGKRTVPPRMPDPGDDCCPDCRGAGAIRGRGQRKVCLTCKGSGKRASPTSVAVEAREDAAETHSAGASDATPLDA
jgi:DnaJ-class molecular chaperone